MNRAAATELEETFIRRSVLLARHKHQPFGSASMDEAIGAITADIYKHPLKNEYIPHGKIRLMNQAALWCFFLGLTSLVVFATINVL